MRGIYLGLLCIHLPYNSAKTFPPEWTLHLWLQLRVSGYGYAIEI